MRRGRLPRVLLALLAVSGSAGAAETARSPNLSLGLQVRSDVPLAHGVGGIGSLFGFTEHGGFWGPGFRIGFLLEQHLASDCRCSPFGDLIVMGVGATASFDLVDRPSWALVADARYRFLAGLKNGDDYPGPVHAPTVGIAFWSKIAQEPSRLQAGVRKAWSFELTTGYWLSNDGERSVALGLGVGFAGGGPLGD